MSKRIVQTENAPKAIGPYSQSTLAGGLVFISGQLGVDPETGKLLDGIAAQTAQSLKNVCAVLEAAGAKVEDVVKVTVFLKDLENFDAMNEIYAGVFAKEQPARCCVQVARLPRDAQVEIEAIAALE